MDVSHVTDTKMTDRQLIERKVGSLFYTWLSPEPLLIYLITLFQQTSLQNLRYFITCFVQTEKKLDKVFLP